MQASVIFKFKFYASGLQKEPFPDKMYLKIDIQPPSCALPENQGWQFILCSELVNQLREIK